MPDSVDDIVRRLLEVRAAAKSGRVLISAQGQAMDGFTELANYHHLLDLLATVIANRDGCDLPFGQ